MGSNGVGNMELTNKVIFRQGKIDEEEIIFMAHLKGWVWLKHKNHEFICRYFDWYLCPIQCLKMM